MNAQPDINKQATTEKHMPYTIDYVTSKDGTRIGYRQYGHGPGLVLVQGAMGSAHNYHQLAGALADTFTVYVPDRRGRGLSRLPFREDYSIQRDVEDLDALLTRTGTSFVFGLSSGGLITLQAALMLPAIRKAAVFEPAWIASENDATVAWIERYKREISQGKVAAALISAMKASQMGPRIFNAIPSFPLQMLVNMGLRGEEKNGSGEYLPMKELAHALQYDFAAVIEMKGQLERFKALHTEILLLGGSASPDYLKVALAALEKTLPHVRRIEFPGMGHAGAWNYDKRRNSGGQPERVAQELRRFFATP